MIVTGNIDFFSVYLTPAQAVISAMLLLFSSLGNLGVWDLLIFPLVKIA